jgi:hypothetical protein
MVQIRCALLAAPTRDGATVSVYESTRDKGGAQMRVSSNALEWSRRGEWLVSGLSLSRNELSAIQQCINNLCNTTRTPLVWSGVDHLEQLRLLLLVEPARGRHALAQRGHRRAPRLARTPGLGQCGAGLHRRTHLLSVA